MGISTSTLGNDSNCTISVVSGWEFCFDQLSDLCTLVTPKILSKSYLVRIGPIGTPEKKHPKRRCLGGPRTPIYSQALRIQSPSQMVIGVYNHLLRKVFRFHYHSQKVIGSLGKVFGRLGLLFPTFISFPSSVPVDTPSPAHQVHQGDG